MCSIVLGALGYRWYSGLGVRAHAAGGCPAAQTATSAQQRSLEYVDNKLALALTAFGTERHQQAVIGLFQAKTAVEFTLGTEANEVDAVPSADDSRCVRGSDPDWYRNRLCARKFVGGLVKCNI